MSVPGIGGFGHPDAEKATPHRKLRKCVKRYAALSHSDDTLRQGFPGAASGEVERVEAGPVLKDVVSCVRFAPGDLESIDKLFARKVEDDPLWVKRVVFVSVAAGEVGIA